MRKILLIFGFTTILFLSCKEKVEEQNLAFNNFLDWWTYHNKYIKFHLDFDTQNAHGNPISNLDFFNILKSEKYIPILIKDKKLEKTTYKLQNINAEKEVESIKSTIKNIANTEIFKQNWIKKEFPVFEFKDLNNNLINNELIKSKTVFLKTYFIRCQACNEEMEILNEFINRVGVEQNLYISLADDNENELKKYLSKKNYNYQFVPNQRNFIKEKLETNSYPMHYLIHNGKVLKVFNKASEMIEYVDVNINKFK